MCSRQQRKAWTLEDDEEDDAKIEADAQEVADLDKSLPLPPAQPVEEEPAQPLDKRRRVASSEAPSAKATVSTASGTITHTTTLSNHGTMNGATHTGDDDIDPLDAFMSSVLAEVDVVPVVRLRRLSLSCCLFLV